MEDHISVGIRFESSFGTQLNSSEHEWFGTVLFEPVAVTPESYSYQIFFSLILLV